MNTAKSPRRVNPVFGGRLASSRRIIIIINTVGIGVNRTHRPSLRRRDTTTLLGSYCSEPGWHYFWDPASTKQSCLAFASTFGHLDVDSRSLYLTFTPSEPLKTLTQPHAVQQRNTQWNICDENVEEILPRLNTRMKKLLLWSNILCELPWSHYRRESFRESSLCLARNHFCLNIRMVACMWSVRLLLVHPVRSGLIYSAWRHPVWLECWVLRSSDFGPCCPPSTPHGLPGAAFFIADLPALSPLTARSSNGSPFPVSHCSLTVVVDVGTVRPKFENSNSPLAIPV